jgi:hypothetical protein
MWRRCVRTVLTRRTAPPRSRRPGGCSGGTGRRAARPRSVLVRRRCYAAGRHRGSREHVQESPKATSRAGSGGWDAAELGADPARNNAFLYAADDARGLKCPLGAHARRNNPRDAKITGIARNHRIIRRSTSYGPMLAKGALEDDGADRGILFFGLQAQLARQFEFVKDAVDQRRDLLRRARRDRPASRAQRRDRRAHHPGAAHPAARDRATPVRRQPRRRVLLRARPTGAALARARRLRPAVRAQTPVDESPAA